MSNIITFPPSHIRSMSDSDGINIDLVQKQIENARNQIQAIFEELLAIQQKLIDIPAAAVHLDRTEHRQTQRI